MRQTPACPHRDQISTHWGWSRPSSSSAAHPFTTASPELLHREKLELTVRALVEERGGVPEAALLELERATAPDHQDRHVSVAEFAAALSLAAAESAELADSASVPTDTTNGGAAVVAASVEVPNPYKGLRAFLEADAEDFFGRDALVEELLAMLDTRRLVAVVGPSGSGKSSVVRAGVVPALHRGDLSGSAEWFVASVIPGVDPLEELETALLRVAVDPPPRLINELRADERGLIRVVEQILPSDDSELVLVVDQFEELFTLAEPDACRAFLAALAAAIASPQSRLRAIVTLRADFYDRPLQEPQIGPLVRTGTVAVVPLAGDELERAIVAPAARVGVDSEQGLVAKMIAEVTDQPGSLPLLQYALTELFERRDGTTMTLRAYRELGSVTGALAGRAEGIYRDMDPAHQDAARQLFARLITPGEGTEDTRRRARRSELRTVPKQVIDEYGSARLLSFDRDEASREPTVEVAHEALIREWPRLRRWVVDDREALRVLRHIDESARAWDASTRDPGDLYRGARLAGALEWADAERFPLSPLEEAFLAASKDERDAELAAERQRIWEQARQNRRLRRMLVVVGVALVAAVLGGVFAFQQSRRADTEAAEATAERARAERAGSPLTPRSSWDRTVALLFSSPQRLSGATLRR